MNKLIIIPTLLIFLPVFSQAESCDYSKEINFSVDTSNILNLFADVGAGKLQIRGSENSGEIVVNSVACADSQNQLDDMDLVHELNGSELQIRTEIDTPQSFFSFGNKYARIDIDMLVPVGLAAQIKDSSGSMNISGLGTLILEDSSGSIEIANIAGAVFIKDSSGSIEVSNINGMVTIEDGAGSISVQTANAVHVIDDGAGGIRINDIAGNVDIDEDGAGSISINNVQGNINIGRDGAGSIDVTSVNGNFIVNRDGAGSIDHSGVRGIVDIP